MAWHVGSAGDVRSRAASCHHMRCVYHSVGYMFDRARVGAVAIHILPLGIAISHPSTTFSELRWLSVCIGALICILYDGCVSPLCTG